MSRPTDYHRNVFGTAEMWWSDVKAVVVLCGTTRHHKVNQGCQTLFFFFFFWGWGGGGVKKAVACRKSNTIKLGLHCKAHNIAFFVTSDSVIDSFLVTDFLLQPVK